MSNKIFLAVIGFILLIFLVLITLAAFRGDVEKTDLTGPSSNNKIGSSEQGVILMEAYSLGCPACADAHTTILKQIREEYSDKIVFQAVHFPLTASFQNALAGHRAVEAAALQGKFWEMHDTLFENRNLWTQQYTNNPVPQLEIFAAEIGLDIEQFKEDFRSEKVNDIINNDEDYMRSLGASATPTFFLNGERIERSRLEPIEVARQTLNQVLDIEEEEIVIESETQKSEEQTTEETGKDE